MPKHFCSLSTWSLKRQPVHNTIAIAVFTTTLISQASRKTKAAVKLLMYSTPCLKKTSHLYNFVYVLHTQFNCDNFWHKCCRESRQSKCRLLYFLTSPNECFYTTWGNRKPGNCVFSLKCCMLFHQKTRNTVKNITWSELNHPSLSKRSTGCKRQDLGREHSILLSVTCSVLAKSVTVSVAVQKVTVVLRQAWSKSQWTMLMGYLTTSTNVRRYQTRHR